MNTGQPLQGRCHSYRSIQGYYVPSAIERRRFRRLFIRTGLNNSTINCGYGVLFNNRFGIVFTNALARRGFLRFCDRMVVSERVLEGLQVTGNEGVVDFGGLEYPRKGLKMGVLRG